jgi:hypothetical protein
MDASGNTVISLLAPATVFLFKMIVLNADGTEAGQVVQKLGLLNVRLGLVAGGKKIGSINGEGWDTWDFNVQNAAGREIARITKKWSDFARKVFTNSDNYVVELHGGSRNPSELSWSQPPLFLTQVSGRDRQSPLRARRRGSSGAETELVGVQ